MDQKEMLRQATANLEDLTGNLMPRIGSLEKASKEQEKWLAEVDKKASGKRFGGAAATEGIPLEQELVGVGLWFQGRHTFLTDQITGRKLMAQGLSELGRTKVALQEDTSTEGGHLVPTEIDRVIHRLPVEDEVVGPICKHIKMGSKLMDLPTMAAAPTVSIVAEEGTIPDSTPANPFGKLTLTAKKISGFFTISEELVNDAAPDVIGEFVVQETALALAKARDLQALEGDGVGLNFTGLFSAAGTNVVAGGSAAITYAKLIDAMFKLPSRALNNPGLSWVMSQKLWRDIVKLTDVSGWPIFAPAGGQTLATSRSIHGVPVRLTDQISTVRGGGSNETTLYIGGFGYGLVYGDRQLMEMRIDPWTRMDTAQLRIRLMERTAIGVVRPDAFTKLTAITIVP